MRLLIVTQKVDKNDPVLGFFHRWIEEFSLHWETIIVICLEKGDYDLPSNVVVLSLGKERKTSRFLYGVRFYYFALKYLFRYDSVFVHMNPIYVLLGGFFWRISGKIIGLWYVHRNVDLKLRFAILFVHKIFTSAKESFQIKNKKVNIVGHGIDTKLFFCKREKVSVKNEKIKILSVGRITRIKNLETLCGAILIIKQQLSIPIEVKIVGNPITEDDIVYYKELKSFIQENKLQENVQFIQGVPQKEIVSFYCDADIAINLAPTGGIDKVVLESMSCGVPTFVANQAFASDFQERKNDFIFEFGNKNDLAQKIIQLWHKDRNQIGIRLHEQVEKKHNLKGLIKKISEYLS